LNANGGVRGEVAAAVAQISKSAVSQVSNLSGENIQTRFERFMVCRFGNRRYGRFRNLRYEVSVVKYQNEIE
jgi:hypothetical protein